MTLSWTSQCLRNMDSTRLQRYTTLSAHSCRTYRPSTVYYIPVIIVVIVLVSLAGRVEGLTCVSCELTDCPVLIECTTGVVKDPCGCCAICAQSEGERCGGPSDIEGKCGLGLYCHKEYRSSEGALQSSAALVSWQTSGSGTGVCKKCERHEYYGCNLISGICQCGISCTTAFTYADKLDCMNTREGLSVDCSKKSCPDDIDRSAPCPTDSYRPDAKPSLDGCCLIPQRCECKTDSCSAAPVCKPGYVAVVSHKAARRPGDCCDTYKCVEEVQLDCRTPNNTILKEGSTVTISDCRTCMCKHGILACSSEQCPHSTCGWTAKLPGVCCPVCKGCVASNGNHYVNGERWVEDNSCVVCECTDGEVRCVADVCGKVSDCRNPRRVQGQCCPVCDDDVDAAAKGNGELVTTSSTVNCDGLSQCPRGCSRRFYIEVNGCNVCICEDELIMCQGHETCGLNCPYGYTMDNKQHCSLCQCSVCPAIPATCDLNCTEYKQDAEGCGLCLCKEVYEVGHTAPVPRCLTKEGVSYNSGQSWFDGCRLCYCNAGREMCSLITCPSLACDQPVLRAGDCCPTCPSVSTSSHPLAVNLSLSCTASHGTYPHTTSWDLDPCTQCICYNGKALCDTQRCPPILCNNPVIKDGHCCATCPEDKAEVKPSQTPDPRPCRTRSQDTGGQGQLVSDGTIWSVSDCESCICRSGVVTCYSRVCAPSSSRGACSVTMLKKGQCCPLCSPSDDADKSSRLCVHKDTQYNHLDTWEDNSLQCTCYHGNTECKGVGLTNGTDSQQNLALFVSVPVIIVFLVLLTLFALIIALLAVVVVRQRRTKKRAKNLLAIPRLLGDQKPTSDHQFTKKRPKSTNLEFLHAVNSDNKYNTAISRERHYGTECCRPLVPTAGSGGNDSGGGNDYVQC